MSIVKQNSQIAKVPELRFPQFREGWRSKPIGDIATVKTGSKDTQNRVADGKYPFFVRSDTIERINSYAFDGEAILTSGDGVGVGKNIHYIRGKFDYHQRVYAIYHFVECISGKFFYQFFKENFLRRVMRLSAKNSVDSVRMSMITDMLVSHPSLPEQKKIAGFLGAVDEKIAQLSRKKDLLTKYKKSIMQKLFSQDIRFKDDNGNSFPDWEEKMLGEVLKIGSGRDYKKLQKGRIPVYGTGGYMTSVDEWLYDGDSVGIGRKGTIDKPVFLTGKFWTVDTLFYTHSFQGVIPKFILAIFQQINWKKYNEASGVPSLSKSTLEKIRLRIPHPDEQQKIADFLSAIDDKINLTSQELTHAKAFKKGLLQQMFV